MGFHSSRLKPLLQIGEFDKTPKEFLQPFLNSIVGKETIAILLGEKRSLSLLKIMLLILIAALLLLSALHLISYLGFVLVASPMQVSAAP